MKYEILLGRSLDPAWTAGQIEEIVAKHTKMLDRFFHDYDQPIRLEVHVSERVDRCRLAYSMNLRDGAVVYVGEKGNDLAALSDKVFDRFVEALKKHQARERREGIRRRWQQEAGNIKAAVPRLAVLREEKNREAFSHLMEKMLPRVRAYIRRRLKVARINEMIPKGKFSAQELTNELYLMLWERFEEGRQWKGDFHLWVYQVADELLEKTLEEIRKEKDHPTIGLEELSLEEWKKMEEKFTTDADGELILEEELDDISYHLDEHRLDEYKMEDIPLAESEEEKILDALEIENEKIPPTRLASRNIKGLLAQAPVQDRSIFDLYVLEQLTPEEIARIKQMEVEEVKTAIRRVKASLRKAFESLFKTKE